jgi:ribosomal-protein-alanine N-acetyltransferase
MALFRLGHPGENVPIIRGDGVTLRPAEMRDYEEWVNLRERSRAFLVPWEPIWPADDLTRSAFRRRVRAHSEEIERDEAYPFFIFNDEEALVGGITIGQVSRGVAQTATLGYWMGQPYAGRGYMSRAVRAVAHYSFLSLRLHRLEAACLPHNDASARLLESVGFTREGYARAYLRINGMWQDHLLYGMLEHDPILAPSQPLRRAP